MRALPLLIALLTAGTAHAVPGELSHQGRLFDSAGLPLDGSASVTFTLYDVATGGTSVWTETQTVDFDNGYFAAQLTGVDDAVFDGTIRYLALSVDGGAETDRLGLVSVPYAVRADQAGHSLTADSATSADTALSADTATSVAGGIVNATEIQIGGTTVIDAGGTVVAAPGAHTHNASEVDAGVLDINRLPIGTGPGTAAAGDHNHSHGHDAAEITAGVLDINRLPIGTSAATASAGDHGHTSAEISPGPMPDFSGPCDGTSAGTIKWTGTDFEGCDGTAWVSLTYSAPTAPVGDPVSCEDWLTQGFSTGDGIYTIDPDGVGGIAPFDVYCDMSTRGGGWTLVGVSNGAENDWEFKGATSCTDPLTDCNWAAPADLVDNSSEVLFWTDNTLWAELTYAPTGRWALAVKDDPGRGAGNQAAGLTQIAIGSGVNGAESNHWNTFWDNAGGIIFSNSSHVGILGVSYGPWNNGWNTPGVGQGDAADIQIYVR